MGFSATCSCGHSPAPIVWASRGSEEAPTSIILYGHYDVQPAEPLDLWASDPFLLAERDGILYGRGIGDDKGPIGAMLMALSEIQSWDGLRITVLLEGGEEIGSPGFGEFLRANGKRLEGAQAALIVDTGCPDSATPTLVTGLRGLISFELFLRTGQRDIHSGYGGCVPNAVQELVRLCAQFHRADGSVAIPRFYDGVQRPAEEELASFQILRKRGEDAAATLGVRCLRDPFPPVAPNAIHAFFPSLEFNGIRGGYEGSGCKTIIPAAASVKFTVRTVPGQDGENLCDAIRGFVELHRPSYAEIDLRCEPAGPAYAIGSRAAGSKFAALFSSMEDSLEKEFGSRPLLMREGGSIGVVSAFKEILGLDSLLVGVVPTASNIHAPNENWPVASLLRTRSALGAFFRSLA
jgi:acetylornithine deacetylase/succinyl-diaminopimelate desuccinylase-like protein